MKILLPYRGEFGIKVWWYVPRVHAIPGEKIVYGEEGEAALYPSVVEFIGVPRKVDGRRRNGYDRDLDFVTRIEGEARIRFGPDVQMVKVSKTFPQARFVPQPTEVYGLGEIDLVLCPRRRDYGASKNWIHWEWLAKELQAQGIRIFAAGVKDSSFHLDCPAAWDYRIPLDATLEAFHSSKAVVATDAGLAHLAVLSGSPLLMITHDRGLVAPGPSSDENGRVMDKSYGEVKIERYREANHTGSEITLLYHAWDDPGRVLRAALARAGRFW